jgi:hypothetical protein
MAVGLGVVLAGLLLVVLVVVAVVVYLLYRTPRR